MDETLCVHDIVTSAQVYADMEWREWSASDLAEIHTILAALALKYPIRYTIEVLQDEPTEVTEMETWRSH